MKYLAIIPARGGSKGIPRKNLRVLAGKPLIVWSVEAARSTPSLDRIVVSSDDEEILHVATLAGAEAFLRPSHLSGDETPTLPVLQDVIATLGIQGYIPDAVVTLQPTSPLRTATHLEEALKLFKSDSRADSLVSVVRVPHIFHPRSVMQVNNEGYLENYVVQEAAPTRRQNKSIVYARNGAAIYITRTTCLQKFIFGGHLLPYEMSAEASVDIDSLADFAQAEALLISRALSH